MGLIKEPLNVDFYFDPRQMTDDDQRRVSEFIAKQKKGFKKQPSPPKASGSKRRRLREPA